MKTRPITQNPRLKQGFIVIDHALSSFFNVAAIVGQITTLREWYKTEDEMSSEKFGERRKCEVDHKRAGTGGWTRLTIVNYPSTIRN